MLSDPYPRGTAQGHRTLIDELLDSQSRLTAVEQFAKAHREHGFGGRSYRQLLPTQAPRPGQQYAFEVDVDRCSGCKACVTACHSLNGLDDGEAWREVSTLISTDWRKPLRQTITSACHHCADPACANGCPVMAYEKEPATGIVRHLDDQCIGCQYCVMMCPYEVPKYSEERGIVRKCDMCSQRLAVGEAPACVQACPNEAIAITLVETASIQGEACALPHLAEPAITRPSTRYVTKQELPETLVASHEEEAAPQPAHVPLVFMLTLTQIGVGALGAAAAMPQPWQFRVCLLGMACLMLGIAASTAHLGRPFKAWRAFLGLKTSWLSREIIGFSMLLPVAGAAAWLSFRQDRLAAWVLLGSFILGVLCVATSGMIYHVTRRPFWSGGGSVGKFLGTTLVAGCSLGWGVSMMTGGNPLPYLIGLVVGAAWKFGRETREANRPEIEQFPGTSEFAAWSLSQSAGLVRGSFGLLFRSRLACLVVGGVVVPLGALLLEPAWILASASFGLICIGESMERSIFFRAVGSLKR